MADEQSHIEQIEANVNVLVTLVTFIGLIGGFLGGILRWGWSIYNAIIHTYHSLMFAHHVRTRWGIQGMEELVHQIESIREIRVRLAEVERISGIGVFTANADQSISWLTPYAIDLFGSDSSELFGRNWLVQLRDESRDKLESKWNLACSKRIGTSCKIVTLDGRELIISINPTMNDKNEVINLYCQVTKA